MKWIASGDVATWLGSRRQNAQNLAVQRPGIWGKRRNAAIAGGCVQVAVEAELKIARVVEANIRHDIIHQHLFRTWNGQIAGHGEA